MEKIYYVTTNPGKLFSARKSFTELNIEVEQAKIKVIEPQCDSIEDIVKSKVKQAYDQLGKPCIAQDSGLIINRWNGFPGAYTEFIQRTLGNEGIIKLMDREEDRSAYFLMCLGYLGPGLDEPVLFYSKALGKIAESERGTLKDYHWSVLSQIFIPEGFDITLAEMEDKEYHNLSNTQNRLTETQQLAKWLKGRKD